MLMSVYFAAEDVRRPFLKYAFSIANFYSVLNFL